MIDKSPQITDDKLMFAIMPLTKTTPRQPASPRELHSLPPRRRLGLPGRSTTQHLMVEQYPGARPNGPDPTIPESEVKDLNPLAPTVCGTDGKVPAVNM